MSPSLLCDIVHKLAITSEDQERKLCRKVEQEAFRPQTENDFSAELPGNPLHIQQAK